MSTYVGLYGNVCLILSPMLASQPCLPAFWVLASLHLLSLLFLLFFTNYNYKFKDVLGGGADETTMSCKLLAASNLIPSLYLVEATLTRGYDYRT